jgi:hypothetical protein
MLAHDPIALVVISRDATRLLVPPDRLCPPYLGELLIGYPMFIYGGVSEVESLGDTRFSHGCLL